MTLDLTVAFFVFNRPDTTARVFERIAAARPRRLLLVADGPRHGQPADVAACARVRELVTRVDWPCQVERAWSDVNLGCGARLASGLDWVFAQAEAAVVLEDDTLPAPSFFPYCAELLARYADDERVGAVAGCNLGVPYDATRGDYVFSRFVTVWGFATWRRVWRGYDRRLADYDPRVFDELFDDERLARHMRARVERTRDGTLDTWDYQLAYALLVQSRLTIVPTRNLVVNLGFGRADAAHTNYAHPLARLPLEELSLPLRHPRHVIASRQAEAVVKALAHETLARDESAGG